MRLDFLDDPTAFLAAAGPWLDAEPVLGTVPASWSTRLVADPALGWAGQWWVLVRDEDDRVVGLGMRTAPFEPHPAYLLPMPVEAARLLARTLHARGEDLLAVNGAMSAARACAEETALLTGGSVVEHEHVRLFELGTLVALQTVAGVLRVAIEADVDLVAEWLSRFAEDADRQAGREPGTGTAAHAVRRDDVVARVAGGRMWLWDDGGPVSLVGAGPSAFGVSRLGPVYTLERLRGRGYAGAATHAVSALLRDAGDRVCLFTDQANPTSNALYERLGYEPLVDTVNLTIG